MQDIRVHYAPEVFLCLSDRCEEAARIPEDGYLLQSLIFKILSILLKSGMGV
jgi:hypothetical protein